MTQPFDDLEDDDYGDGSPSFASDPVFDDDLDLDSLRQQSARSGSTYDDMENDPDMDDSFMDDSSGGSRFALGNFTRGQRLTLAFLVLLDILAIGFGVLVVMGRVSLP